MKSISRHLRCALIGAYAIAAAVHAGPLPDSPAQWQKRIATQLDTLLSASNGAERILASPTLRTALAQSELLRVCGTDAVWKVACTNGGRTFLNALLADGNWLDSFLWSGGVDAQCLENLRLLHARCTGWDDAVVRRMGTALAMQWGAGNRYRLVDRFVRIRDAYREGLMNAAFDRMNVREMRSAVYTPGTARDYQFLLDNAQYKLGDYLGACWAVNYVDPNVYGFSVQGWGYIDEWCHAYGNGTGNRPLIAHRQVGGVCGTLSCYGASVAQAHGIMSTTVGQPGHCAYVVRIGERWPIGYDVCGAWSTGFGVYEGTTYMTSDQLFETVEANRPAYEAATRLAWVARAQRALLTNTLSVGVSPLWLSTYRQALSTQPLNYPLWMECIKALEAKPEAMTNAPWLELGRTAAGAFTNHQEAGWALVLRCFGHAAAALKPADRAARLLECHALLSQKTAPKMYGYPSLPGFLNTQADQIGDPAVAVDFFGRLLSLHYSEKPELNWIFGTVLNWGGDRFGRNPAMASNYAATLGAFFEAKGEAVGKQMKETALAGGIRKASEAGDMNTYRQWNELAKRLLPAPVPGDVFLNPQQMATRPKVDPFPGALLSQEGMLQTINVAGSDRPLTYGQVLGGGDLGFFDTAGGAKPWAQVQLAGDSELSGIAIVNRYEYGPEFPWDVPLKVSVSADGKTWSEVATFDKAQPLYRVDLQEKKPRARFVRLERPDPDPAKPNTGRFHFRNVLIYGKKLY